MEKKVYYSAITLVSFVIFLFSCSVFADLCHAQSTKDLYELAKKEGTVNIGSSLAAKLAKPVTKIFEAKYPGVKVKYTRQGTSRLMSVLETEMEVGR